MDDLVLVTGGAGFVGSHVVDLLVLAGVRVRVIDSVTPEAHGARRPVYLRDDVEYVEADVRDRAAAARAVRGVDAVCHQAAKVGLGQDFADAPDYAAHNDLGTAQLLAALHERGFAGRLVLASSMVVYGEGRYHCARHGIVPAPPREPDALARGAWEPLCPECLAPLVPEAVPEDAPLDPRNVYAATKLHQEHLCAAFAREHPDVEYCALRYHNVYGPRMPRDTPYAGVASIFRSALAAGRVPRVFEDGNQLRDFVHVSDVARANVIALTAPVPVAGAFNVASGDPRSVADMARALAGPSGPAPDVTGDFRLGDVRHVFASPERAAEVLGFRAEIPFGRGMREFAAAPLRDPATAAAA